MNPNDNQSPGSAPGASRPASSQMPPGNTVLQPESTDGTDESGQGIRDALSIIGVLLAALVLAWGLISFVFQSYQVDGPSMQVTLQNDDHLVVWKVPRTLSRITGNQYVPNRGDVIVFNEPGLAEFGQGSTKQLIKRVIGLPDERVIVRNGTVTIINKQNPTGFQPDKTLKYGNVIPTTSGNIDITLGPKQIFVCGDNRPDSLDSRVFGPVDTKNIVGKLVMRVLPINEVKFF
jgi:signal peptidase I